MSCYFTEDGSKTFLGTIRDPFASFNFVFEIYDKEENLDFILSGECCQAFFWCRFICDSCQVVNFDQLSNNGNTKLGELTRYGRSYCENALKGDQNDILSVDFPANTDWKKRAMLMNMAIFIDYCLFERKNNDNNGNN